MKHRILLIGASVRVGQLVREVLRKYPDYEFVGILDSDAPKAQDFMAYHGLALPVFGSQDFDLALRSVQPDMAVITTSDYTHADYIVRCLDRKVSCLVEKPLCINAEQCRAIWEAQQRNPEVYAVTMHNSRYHRIVRKTRELIQSGAIGEIRSIRYDEKLDHFHGSSYYRRWNRHKAYSGGLQIHKACHHFDKINFLLGVRPEWVAASGCQTAYGPSVHKSPARRCCECPEADTCEFFLDYHKNPVYEKLYGVSTHAYTPDLCVYSDEADAEDFLGIFVMYSNGIPMNYSLSACCAYEGESIIFEGTTGRLEMSRLDYRRPESRGGDAVSMRKENTLRIVRFATPEVENYDGEDDNKAASHGGCDELIYKDLFGDGKSDMLATLQDGIYAVLVGAAANVSMAQAGRKVEIASLFTEG